MIGLFWVTEEDVHLGLPPAARMTGVSISPSGVRRVGPDERVWTWPEVTDLQVDQVPVRSAVVRWATRAATFAAAALDAWVPGTPAEMTVAVSSGTHRTEVPVFSAAATAYTQREVDLSHALLAHFVRGTASPALLTDWWKETRPVGVLRSRQREDLLEYWAAPLLS
ncbi:hypothetical protein DWB77_00541 [Streptomyces hundungensis]|uniref:Uncharacterized protein n=1 Tax=Streptomyces hundungensis TaxID=1077946 RepID=A0A387H4X6_9ACTN|nr:hypothetical protein [Streptomyces hundungensis]AYG78434.1 hypothetical protein DWB77_00541 [Streptomyces hundungensis]